jgi:hypothetical protein
MLPHAEQIDIIGQVNAWLSDLEVAWQAEENQKRVRVSPDQAFASFTYTARRRSSSRFSTGVRMTT